MSSLFQDLRFGLRLLRRSLSFTAAVVISLALGIGLNSVVFSTVNAFLLRPLPFSEPDRLVHLFQIDRQRDLDQLRFSMPEFLALREQTRAIEDLAAYDYLSRNLSGGDDPERIKVARVSAELFSGLGVSPLLGRTFAPEEDEPGQGAFVVLSHGFWQRRFAGEPGILGRTIRLDDVPHTIIGVMPPGFQFPFPSVKLWVPLPLDSQANPVDRRWFLVIGRLAPGVSLERAQTETAAILHRLHSEVLKNGEDLGFNLLPLREALTFFYEVVRLTALLLMAAVAFVLLIACANIANLLLARSAAREHEVAVRLALGAPRLRLARQAITESGILASLGGAFGLLLACGGTRALAAVIPEDLYRVGEIGVDRHVIVFTAGLSLATALILGLTPALQTTRCVLTRCLGEGSPFMSGGTRGHRLRQAFVVWQLGLSSVLLIGAALMIRSLLELQRVDPGVETENILTLGLTLPRAKYPESHDAVSFHQEALERIEDLWGVTAAAAVHPLPLNFESPMREFRIEGRVPASLEEKLFAEVIQVSPHYFQVMGIPLVGGRSFTDADGETSVPSVIINRAMARRFWPGQSPIGRRMWLVSSTNAREPLTVVGIVGDVRSRGLHQPAYPQMYRPLRQAPLWGGHLVVRTASHPTALVPALRKEIRGVDASLPISDIRTMEQVASGSLLPWRLTAGLLGALSVGALCLAAAGLYGLTAHLVVQRFREIAIRIALGARRREILRLFLLQGLKLTTIGLGLGLLGALALTRAMGKLIHGIDRYDPLSFLGVPLLLLSVAVLATYLPARRAARLDPMEILKGG